MLIVPFAGAGVVWYISTMANTERLQVLVTEAVRKELDKLRGDIEMSAYIRHIIVVHTATACKKCGK